MKNHIADHAPAAARTALGRLLRTSLALVVCLLPAAPALAWQTPRKLPAPEKIVAEYLKATGGKKRWAGVRDAVYEWRVVTGSEARLRVLLKAPGSARTERRTPGGEYSITANPRMAWRGNADVVPTPPPHPSAPPVETLTGAEAHGAKLQALLDARHLVDFKKMKVLARAAGVEEVEGEPAYVVEFSTREGGRPLSPERAAREERRVGEELAKAEREGPKRLRERQEKRERERAKRAEKRREQGASGEDLDEDDVDVGIATFLRSSEFVSPRREQFRGRDTVVFDFRPRPGFRPKTRGESIASKLSGVAWVDPVDRQVVRLEARLVEGFKIGGGLMASIKPGAAFAFEQTRLADGVWLPRFTQVNASARVLIFAGVTVNQTQEFGDYKRFDAKTDDGRLDAPKEP